jgi:cytochrome c oxidase subunit 1
MKDSDPHSPQQEAGRPPEKDSLVPAGLGQNAVGVQKFQRITFLWMVIAGLLFLAFSLDGYFLRMYQSRFFPTTRPEWFYAVLTLHGMGMVGLWFVAGMAAVSYLLANYIRPPLWASWLALGATLIGFVLLIVATTKGLFGTGWYFLYPLPLYSQGTWPPWATGCFFAALVAFCGAWLIWSVAMIAAILKRYPLRYALGWHYLSSPAGAHGPEVPPIVLITIVALIPGVAGFLDAFALFLLYLMQWQVKGFVANALLMKNLTFFFGHMTVHATMYLGVAVVYELLPTFNGRSWKMSKRIVLAWNAVLAMVLFAYFHHLYMDFVQPRMLQIMGQMMSYFSAVPAAVVSIFDGLWVVYGSRMRWTIASIFMFLGLMGWAVGGVGAVIDSTISINSVFHNTLWVPAHFHTYYLMGVVIMLLGFASHLGLEASGLKESRLVRRLVVTLFVIGGYGFVLMFFWSGAHSIPRRYAIYPHELAWGTHDARVSVVFIGIFILGLLVYLWETGRCYLRIFRAQLRKSHMGLFPW